MEKVDLIERKGRLQNIRKTNSAKNKPLVLTYDRTLPNISDVARKNWHILQINLELRNVFVDKPTIKFKKNKNIQTRPHRWPFNKGWKSCQEEIRKTAR